MELDKFTKEVPDLEGYTIGDIRMTGVEPVGFVLKDKEGNPRYILYFGDNLKVEDYW